MTTGSSVRQAGTSVLFALLVSGCTGAAAPTPGPTAIAAPSATATAAPVATAAPTAVAPTLPPGLDGRLLFTRFDEATHTAVGVFSSAVDGSGEVAIPMPSSEGAGQWSTRGDLIAVATHVADGRVGTAILDKVGHVVRVLNLPNATINLACGIWSPDDARLACESWDDADDTRAGIYTVRSSDGGDLKRLTSPPAGHADLPGDWGTDALIVFKRNSGDETNGPLYLVAASGGEARPLTTASYEDPGRFSPDGNLVATSADGVIRIVDATGAIVSTIGPSGAYAFGPAWSPDGKWVVYSVSRSGPFAELYISKPDGSELFQVTHTTTNEIGVDWAAPSG